MHSLSLAFLLSFAVPSFATPSDTIPLTPKRGGGNDSPSAKAAPERVSVAPGEETAPPSDSETPPPGGIDRPKYISGIDVYGSSRITESTLRTLFGNEFSKWLELGLAGNPKAAELEVNMTETLKQKFDLAFAQWNAVHYFDPDRIAVYLTLDVVEKTAASRRMNFLPPPTKTFSGPAYAEAEKLITQWQTYENLALDLIEQGALEPESEECPAFHCPFGHKHPKLKPFEKIFVTGVKAQSSKLAEMVAEDKRPEARAAAALLLAYIKDGKQLVNLMVGRIKDPDAGVRNNALRILGEIAQTAPQYAIPLPPIVAALDFPQVTDRVKALFVAFHLALQSPQARSEIRATASGTLVDLIAGGQPDQRELAHQLLKKVSGKEFAATDLPAWRSWEAKDVAPRTPAKSK